MTRGGVDPTPADQASIKFSRHPRFPGLGDAAVNCAAGSCPRLASWAFTGETLEAQLEQSMREMVNSTDHVRVNEGRLEISKIFDWYGGDFGASRQDVAGYVKSFAAPDLLAQIEALGERPKVRFLDYDWSLNAR